MSKIKDLYSTSLDLVVTLSDLSSDKATKYLNLLMRSEPIFDFFKIRVIIYTLESREGIVAFEKKYATGFKVIHSKEQLEAYRAIKKKTIYGTEYEIVYSYLFLLACGKEVVWKKRISKETILEIAEKANLIRYKEIEKNLENLFDNVGGLW